MKEEKTGLMMWMSRIRHILCCKLQNKHMPYSKMPEAKAREKERAKAKEVHRKAKVKEDASIAAARTTTPLSVPSRELIPLNDHASFVERLVTKQPIVVQRKPMLEFSIPRMEVL